MLRLDRLTKHFRSGGASTAAVEGACLDVPHGQFCVLLGSSGAGKSTLLRMIAGMVPPTSGQVDVDGIRLTPRTRRRIQDRIGIVHQQFHLVPRLTVLENVLCGVASRTATWRTLFKLFPHDQRLRACELLRLVSLEELHLYRKAAQLSGGQQQRVAIARAFIRSPKLVLADEPVASLDPSSSRAILALLRDASRRLGATVLCSLHQVEYALEFADRIVAMRGGRIDFDGRPGELTGRVIESIYGSADQGHCPPGGQARPETASSPALAVGA